MLLAKGAAEPSKWREQGKKNSLRRIETFAPPPPPAFLKALSDGIYRQARGTKLHG